MDTFLTNYHCTTVAGTLTITKATGPVVVQAEDFRRAYGETNPPFACRLVGILPWDSNSIPVQYQTTATNISPIGQYAIVPMPDATSVLSNYTWSVGNGTLTVTQALLTVTVRAGDTNRPYGEANPSRVLCSLVGTLPWDGTSLLVAYDTSATTNSPMGPYPIQPQVGMDTFLTNYRCTTVAGTLTITKATGPLVVQAEDARRAYGETNPPFACRLGGVMPWDSNSIPVQYQTTATNISPIGQYAIVPIPDATSVLSNYTWSVGNGTLTVTQALQTVTLWAGDTNRPYGEANPPRVLCSLAGTLPWDGTNLFAAYDTSAITNSPVGPYPIQPQVGMDTFLTNYRCTTVAGTLTVTKATGPVVVQAEDFRRAYGETNPPFACRLVGILPWDSNSIPVQYQTTATNISPIGQYAIVPMPDATSVLSNYTWSVGNGTLTVTQALLTVTVRAGDTNRPYGEANPPRILCSLAGTLPWDGTNLLVAYDTSATTNSPVGPYPIQPQVGMDTFLTNYNCTTVAGTLTIGKAVLAIVVSATSTNRPYGTINPVFTGTLINVLHGDNISATFVSFAVTNTPVGLYDSSSTNAITPLLLDPNGRLANYTVATNRGTLTITKATAPIIVTSANSSRHFGQPNPVFTGTLTNVLPGDRITATFSSAATPSTLVGVYAPPHANAIWPVFADPDGRLANYNVVTNAGTLTILTNNSPTVHIISPTNGSIFLVGMDIPITAEVLDPDGVVTNVYFLNWTNRLADPNVAPPLYYLTLSNLLAGSYRFAVEALDDVGRTNRSEDVNVTILTTLPSFATTIDTNSLEVWQTGLYLQDCWVTNPTPASVQSVRIEVRGLVSTNTLTVTNNHVITTNTIVRTNAWLWNATGTNSGSYVPYVQYNPPIGAGQVQRLRLQYYVPDGSVPGPILSVIWLAPTGSTNAVGTFVHIGRIVPFTNGTILLNFTTLSNRQYFIEYSTNLLTWNTSLPGLTGGGGVQQWLDDGPPLTLSHPTNAPCRYYRLLLLPNN